MRPLRVGSLFSGIGGFDLGFERAGCEIAWQIEQDTRCQEVLRRHWPEATIHGDITTIQPGELADADVWAGGFPCQDVSVAGKRAGLGGARSGLFYEFARLLDAARPRWVVIENVPGLLSSNGGDDMGIVLGTLGELGYGWAFRILDAQYDGLAQRRERVFIVGHSGGDTRRAASVLFEPESLRGDPPPSRAAGQGVAGTIGGSSQSGGFRTSDLDNSGAFVVASALTREGAAEGAWRGDGSDNLVVADTLRTSHNAAATDAIVGCLTSPPKGFGMGNQTVDAGHVIAIQDAREVAKDQNGLGVAGPGDPMYTLDGASQHAVFAFDPAQVTSPDNRSQPGPGKPTPTLHGNPAMVFEPRYVRNGRGAPDTVVPALTAHAGRTGKGDAAPVVLDTDQVAGTVGARDFKGAGSYRDGGIQNCAMVRGRVRRLMPVEYARLQGFLDDWNDWIPDSTRYKQFGNAVAVPVSTWIARRIMAVEEMSHQQPSVAGEPMNSARSTHAHS